MAWQADGTFLRRNPDFAGTDVWQQDQSAAIKIIASRHDIHDEDLALGIADCINLDGYNSMRANLNIGGNKVIGVADGTAPTDVATYGQLDLVAQEIVTVDQRVSDLEITVSDNYDNLNARITALENSGFPNPMVVADFKSLNTIKHDLNDTGSGGGTVDMAAETRHFLDNAGALTLTFTNVPSGDDPDIGPTWQAETQIVIYNGANPGTINIAGLTFSRQIGTPNLNANQACILTVLSSRRGTGSVVHTAVWSG